MDLVTLITPTGMRHHAFYICEKLIAKQTYKNIQWIVVDDGEERVECALGQTYLRGPVTWKENYNTQRLNLMQAIEHVKGKYVFFIEDDDYYAPDYIEFYVSLLSSACDVVGESDVKYYHLKSKSWLSLKNYDHTSLAATAFNAKHMPIFLEALHSGEKFFDITFWKYAQENDLKTLLFNNKQYSVGIKGFPGRKGIGSGHAPAGYISDPFGNKLRSWVGDEDFKLYLPYLGTHKGAIE